MSFFLDVFLVSDAASMKGSWYLRVRLFEFKGIVSCFFTGGGEFSDRFVVEVRRGNERKV